MQITAVHGRDNMNKKCISDVVLVVIGNFNDIGVVDVLEDFKLLAISVGNHRYLFDAEFSLVAADGSMDLGGWASMNDLA